MAIKIKNIDTETHSWGGKLYEAGELYTTENARDAQRYGADDVFIKDYTDGKAEVYDGDRLLSPVSKVLFYLQHGKALSPADDEDKPYFRLSSTRLNWYYSPRALDFYTGKYNSLYNRRDDNAGIDEGTDYGDAWMRFYERGEYGEAVEMVKGSEESAEEFQARLDTDCVKTVVEFENEETIDVWGAKLSIESKPQSRAYLWCVAVPDIPYAYGGSKPFMGGGMNLQMIGSQAVIQFDGKTSKEMSYHEEHHTNKIAIVVKHAAGENIGIQLIFDYYEE